MLTRKEFFNRISVSSVSVFAFGSLLPFPFRGLANWNQDAFHSRHYQKALESLYGSNVIKKTNNIKIQAPDVAENGASVPITVSTSIKGIETLSIFIENNPLPLIASYNLRQYAIPNFSVRVKIAKSSPIHVVVKSQGKLLSSSKKIHVSVGGCAEG
ncbi:MAG: hypothetical protein CM1200mP30_07400 [Pseudomonadota bacterium]|jgi:sulfur-oxidizing protein SoxY|nr:MAG: hypothetical protein CM1200mP30_07400 [Pseudomonadota bacterium]